MPPVVGVFVNQPTDEVNATAETVGLDMVQLHGTETPEYWEQIERPLIITRRISSSLTAEQVEDELGVVAEFTQRTGSLSLIEPHVEGEPGGAGVSLDFALAERLARRHSFILAGGSGSGQCRDGHTRRPSLGRGCFERCGNGSPEGSGKGGAIRL